MPLTTGTRLGPYEIQSQLGGDKEESVPNLVGN